MNDSRHNSESLQGRFGANSVAVLASQLVNNVTASVFAVVFIRHFGRDEYGVFSTVFAYLSFFAIVQSLGIEAVMLREVARDRSRIAQVSEAAGLRLALSFATMVLSWCLLPFLNPTRRLVELVVLASLSAPLSMYPLYFVAYAADLKMAYPNLLFSIWSIAFTALRLGLIAVGLPLEAFVVAGLCSDIVVFAIARRLGKRSGAPLGIRFDWSVAKHLIAQSWPIALCSLAMQLLFRIDQIMLFRMSGAAEVGLYSVPVRLVEFANIIPTVFVASAFPVLARLGSPGGEASLQVATRLSFRAMSCLGFLLATYLMAFPDFVLGLLFGGEFTAAAVMARILALGMVLNFLNSIFLNQLIAANRQRFAATLAAAAALLNVGLNVSLIPRLGGEGAAIATLVAYASIPVIAWLTTRYNEVGRMALQSLIRPLVASAAALAFVHWAALDFVPAFVGVALVYSIVLVLSGEIGMAETRIVSRMLNIPRSDSAVA